MTTATCRASARRPHVKVSGPPALHGQPCMLPSPGPPHITMPCTRACMRPVGDAFMMHAVQRMWQWCGVCCLSLS